MKKHGLFVVIILMVLGVLVNSCDNPNGTTETDGEQNEGYDVYIAGSYSNAATNKPCYWKNGVKTDLPLIGEWYRGWADKIIVDGNDIYVLGTIDNGSRSVGGYWKNGKLSLLPNQGYAFDIAVSNGDVYIAGYYYPPTETDTIACYWKNNVKTDLAIGSGTSHGVARAIAVSENTVYITGDYYVSTGGGMVWYWKNGILTELFQEYEYYYFPEDIAIVGNDVYITGTIHNNGRKPWYWKNGSATILDSGTTPQIEEAYSISVVNNTVYISGYYTDESGHHACYWKNGTRIPLSGGTAGKDSFAYSIAIADDDIYIAGATDIYFDFDGENMSSGSSACYWKNGVKTTILDNASCNDITVVLRNK